MVFPTGHYRYKNIKFINFDADNKLEVNISYFML
jgi:hypothetical protein